MLRRRIRLRAGLVLGLGTFAHSSPALAQPWPNQLTATPKLVQDGFGSGGSSLPGDGLMYCVPTSTTMSLLYLGNAGFSQIAPANATAAQSLNLELVISGLFSTTPLGGTNGDGKKDGLEIYFAARGLGSPTTNNNSIMSNANYQYHMLSSPSVAALADFYTDTYQVGNLTVGQLDIGWYTQDGNTSNYTRTGGHGITLLNVVSVNNGTNPSTGVVTINNPEPHSLGAPSDIPENVQQIANMGLPFGNLTNTSGSPIKIVGTQFGPRDSTAQQAIITGAGFITINANAIGMTPATWFMNGVKSVNTNGGDLDAIAPIQDGNAPGGITKQGLGTLSFLNANQPTVTGTFTVAGGTLFTTNPTATPFGTGNTIVSYGKLALAPTGAGGASLDQSLASGTGKKFFYEGGGVLALTPQSGQTYTLTIGGNTDGTTLNFNRFGNGTLVIAPSGGIATLGIEVFLKIAGHHDNLPITANGIVTPAIIGQDTSASGLAGDFLTYNTNGSGNTTTGFGLANYTLSSSTPINSPSITSSTVYSVSSNQIVNANNTVHVHALKVGTSTSGGVMITSAGNTTLNIGPQAAGVAGVILNGGTIATTKVDFGPAEALIYTSAAGGAISGQIQGSGGLTSFGPGILVMSGQAYYSGATTVQAGALAINGTLGTGPTPTAVIVNTEATLKINNTGQVNGSVTAQNGGAVLLAGGTLGPAPGSGLPSATLTTDAVSVLRGTGTINVAAIINGQIAAGSTPGPLTFTGAANFTSTSYFTWKLFELADNNTINANGNPWTSLVLTGPGSGINMGGNGTKDYFHIELDLTSVNNPNSFDPFWNSNHTWTVLTSAETPANHVLRLSAPAFVQGEFSYEFSANFTEVSIHYQPAPEPAAILGIATLGSLMWRHRKRR